MSSKVCALFLAIVLALGSCNDHNDTAQNAQAQTKPPAATTTHAPEKTTPTAGPITSPDEDKLDTVSNPDVFGCTWPDDYENRVKFCLQKSKFADRVTSRQALTRGIFDAKVITKIMKSCDSQCSSADIDDELDAYTDIWRDHIDWIKDYKQCLQSNTEGMVKLCGPQTPVGKILSGAAGMHLNLINVLTTLQAELPSLNHSHDSCWHKALAAAHLTVAMYVKTGSYKENSVMCWNAARQECDKYCAKMAAELACVTAACRNVTSDLFQQFGIWQWYYLSPDAVHESCKIPADICQVEAKKSLFDDKKSEGTFDQFKTKMKQLGEQFKTQVEETFHQPYYIVLAATLGIIGAFILFVTLICMHYHGLLCSEKRRKVKYSSLLTPDDIRRSSQETKGLVAAADVDDFE